MHERERKEGAEVLFFCFCDLREMRRELQTTAIADITSFLPAKVFYGNVRYFLFPGRKNVDMLVLL